MHQDEHKIESVVQAWERLAGKAGDCKRKHFSQDAADAMRYFRGSAKEIWSRYLAGAKVLASSDGDGAPAMPPSFQIALNKTMECVALFGPHLYPTNPVRDVTPMAQDVPSPAVLQIAVQNMLGGAGGDPQTMQMMTEQFSGMLGQQAQTKTEIDKEVARVIYKYLNYTPRELDLAFQARQVIDETVIKGMSLFEHKLCYPYEGGPPLVGSFFRTVDDLLQDPDSETWKDNNWIILKSWRPWWEVEKDFPDLKPGSMKQYATMESHGQQAAVDGDWDSADQRESGASNDLVCVMEVYSKIGVGDNLKDVDEEIRGQLGEIGRYCYLAIVKGCPYPLNLPSHKMRELFEAKDIEGIKEAFRWPTPFWRDDEWPVTPMVFHQCPNSNWPLSHMKSGMPLLKFLNWAMGYLCDKVRVSSQTTLACWKQAGEEFSHQFLNGDGSFKIIALENAWGAKNINEIVSFLDVPAFQGDIYRMIAWVIEELEKSLALNEILYGMSSTQDRSAETSKLKHQAATARIDDMHEQVLRCCSIAARKEALLMQMLLGADEMAPVVGWADAKFVWEPFVLTRDLDAIIREFTYTLEADSAKRMNRTQKLDALSQMFQVAMPIAQQLAMNGNPGPWNGMWGLWAKFIGFEDGVQPILIPPPDPNQPTPQQQEQQAQQQEQQFEMAVKQQEAQQKQQEAEAKMAMEQMKFELEKMKVMVELQAEQNKVFMGQQADQAQLAMKGQEHQMKLAAMEREFELKMAQTQADLGMKAAGAAQDMGLKAKAAGVDLRTKAVQGAADIVMQQAKGAAQVDLLKKQAKAKPKPATK